MYFYSGELCTRLLKLLRGSDFFLHFLSSLCYFSTDFYIKQVYSCTTSNLSLDRDLSLKAMIRKQTPKKYM